MTLQHELWGQIVFVYCWRQIIVQRLSYHIIGIFFSFCFLLRAYMYNHRIELELVTRKPLPRRMHKL